MPIATFRTQTNPVSDRIDREKGIIYGCQIVKAGATARFAKPDGSPDEIDVTPKLIKRLAELAEGRSLNGHWTHDWAKSDQDPLHAKIGGWKNIRIDEATGNLVGDLHLMPSQYREAVIWLADNTPDGAMMSIVFSFEREGPRHANPIRFDGVDLVEYGAATDAFFSRKIEQPTQEPMTKEELIALFADPQVKEAARAAFAEVSDEDEDKKKKEVEESEKEEEAAALALEKEYGVTEADHNAADKGNRMTVAMLRSARANKRQVSSEVVAAEARFTRQIGNTKPPGDQKDGREGTEKEHAFLSLVKKHEATGAPNATALLRAQNDNPSLYNDWMKTRGIFKAKGA